MFGMGLPELLLVLVIAFIVIGPEKLPHLARVLGKGLAEIRRATEDVRNEIEKEGRALREELKEEESKEKEFKKEEPKNEALRTEEKGGSKEGEKGAGG